MTTSRITDEALNQLIAIESLASDNASYDNRQADSIYHSDVVSALEELRQCRAVAAAPAESEVIYCYHYNVEMKTCNRAGYIGTRERVIDRVSYYSLMALIGEANNDTVTAILSLGYLGEKRDFLQLQNDSCQVKVSGGAV